MLPTETINITQPVTLTLTPECLAIVLQALQAGTYRDVKPHIDEIEHQIRSSVLQTQAQAAATDPANLGLQSKS